MRQRIYRDTSLLKHEYAFDEWSNVVHISKAKDYLEGKKCKYFLDEKLDEEIILKAGGKYQWHFSLKSEYFEWGGKKYLRDHSSESPQHYDAKLKIIGQGYFEWDNYRIPVKNCRLEKRFGKSYFRADLIAQLKSGENVFIEIVKTSDTSKSKEKYIIENQLPTFKLYIDNEGNFEYKRFDFIGNNEIESIRETIRRKQFEFEGSEGSRKSAWRDFYNEKERIESKIETHKNKIDQEIQDYFERIKQRIKIQSRKENSIIQKIGEAIEDSRTLQTQFRKKLNHRHGFMLPNIVQYRNTRKRIEIIKSRIKSVKALGDEIQRMESLFIQVAPLVKWEWIDPRSTQEPQGKDRLLQLKYLLT